MFKTQNFCHIASNNRNQVKVGVFVYRTTDDLATVLTSGYFNDRIIDINLHDLIIHEKVDSADATKVERTLLCVTERTLENVGTSIIKSKWEGDIEQDIADIEQEIAGLDNRFVKLDGTSVMTAPLKFSAGSMRGAVGPYLNGVSFWKSDSQGNITNIANLTDSQFTPVTTNSINLGNTTHTWKDAYVARVITSVLNNGYDIAVPVTNSADTLALKSEVDLAANSGRMITDQGVWYAKMYAATVAPSAENGTNYADFSQTDGQGNPIIVLYERQNGAWVQTQTIVPPAEYDGYVPITSKIWDIVEQAGQQGGRILWNHQSKDFTPYPQIISFENAALTGTSTAPTPTESSPNNQIVNKEYVDNKTSQQGYHPDLFDVKWADHILNDAQWLRADTFSWQSGAVYQAAYAHLKEDYDAAASMLDWAVATHDTNLGSHSWAAIAGNGTKFVALGRQGYTSTSLDGINWTPATQNSNLNNWAAYSVVWDGTKFVALGSSSQVSTSTDGINWTPATQVANFDGHNFSALAWNGTKFVALNSDGYISTSTDGTTWTAATQNANLGSNRSWMSVAWDGSKFIALSTIGHVSTSTDGTNWTAATRLLDISRTWKSIVWDGIQFVALADSGYISTSIDGTSWSTATKATNLGNRTYSNIAYDGTKFVALNPQGYTSYKVNHIYTETIAGITITYYLAEDGHKLVLPDQESNVTAIYNATGVAWYYIIDTTNQRFKLPRTQFAFTGIRNSVGGFVEAGLPNINGDLRYSVTLTDVSGAFTSRTGAYANKWGSGEWGICDFAVLDASRSSSIYGNSDTVQPKATEMYLYFYVGQFTQTALENTAGLNAELFNGKADLNLSNTASNIDFVVESQEPTADNGYTWYRKYKSGWVEQGGTVVVNSASVDGGTYSTTNITFPIALQETRAWKCQARHDRFNAGFENSTVTTGAKVYQVNDASSSFANPFVIWEVKGMAAN